MILISVTSGNRLAVPTKPWPASPPLQPDPTQYHPDFCLKIYVKIAAQCILQMLGVLQLNIHFVFRKSFIKYKIIMKKLNSMD